MIRIRLFRTGRKKQPFYKIVVTDKNNPPRSGRFIEDLGYYDPLTKQCDIKEDKAKHWIGEGASVSDTVYNLFIKKGVVVGKKRPVHAISKKEIVEEASTDKKSAEGIPVTEEPTKETSEEVDKKPVEETPIKEENPVKTSEDEDAQEIQKAPKNDIVKEEPTKEDK